MQYVLLRYPAGHLSKTKM